MDLKYFYGELAPYIESSYINSELKNVLVTFTSSRNWVLDDDPNAEAMALIRPALKHISFNPLRIASSLFDLRHELKLVDSDDNFTRKGRSLFSNLVKTIKTFLLLHEIGHWLYTEDMEKVVPYMATYCKDFPAELVMYLFNVVEDSVIQRLFMLEYRGSFYRQCFDIGICCFQGAEAVKTYVSDSEKQDWSIRTKLFYFIIRAYNLHDSEVQAMFNIPDKIGWKDDTINAFDQAITTIDKNDRAKYVCEVLAPLVFRDLVEEIDASQGTQATSDDDLLAQDKLYKSNNPSAGTSNSNTGSSNSSNSKPEPSSDSSQEDNKEEDNSSEVNSNEGSDGNSSQEDTEEQGEEGEGTAEDSEDTTQSGTEGDSPSESSESGDNSGDADSNNQVAEEAPKVTPQEPVEKTITEQIAEACKELNNSINASSDPDKVSSAPKLKQQSNPLAVSCNVKDHTQASKHHLNDTASMNNTTLTIYGNAISVLDNIFTMSNSVLRGLDQGELDEDELYTYYTEKNLNIYKEECKVKQDKKVVVYFILDNSGSMAGPRFNCSSAAFVGLIHALEDIQIKCCFLTFGEDVRLIKKFDDPTSFLGTESPLQYMVNRYVSDLESDTNLYPALDYVVNDETFMNNDPDLCKVVIVATDGCTNKESACAYVAEQISSEALMFAIGLDMSGSEDYLQRVMPGAIVRNYNGSTIATQLPEDIYEEIINRFLLY